MKRAEAFIPEDLIAEILIRSPARSIGRFRCVCKRWLSLSSDPKFIVAHASRAQISALFASNRTHAFLDSRRRWSSYSLPLHLYSGSFSIESSCNGLILFRQDKKNPCLTCLFLFNPVTMTSSWPAISLPKNKNIWKATLAFDPSRSLHLKIVVLCRGAEGDCVEIYCSQTRNWRTVASPPLGLALSSPVYFKGRILWWDFNKDWLLCFDVESERFQTRVQLPTYDNWVHCLGPSGGEFYFIGQPEPKNVLPTSFDVWQLLPDFSRWSHLCSVSLLDIRKAWRPTVHRSKGYPIYFLRGKGGGDQMIMVSEDKLFSYHLQNKTCTILSNKLEPGYLWWEAFPYAETMLSPFLLYAAGNVEA